MSGATLAGRTIEFQGSFEKRFIASRFPKVYK